ncbi:MAG TPA: hypothetical protein VF972_08780 [Actinomycetota bacterium]
MRVGATVLPAGAKASPPKVLQLFYTAPVLVRAGERVRIPVDVICATDAGSACDATVGLRVSSGGSSATRTTEATKGLKFDVTGPARRALGSRPDGVVRFALSAKTTGGRTVSLPEGGRTLAFYVTRSMPIVTVPAIPFGHVRRGRTVLFLRWGSGPNRVGLQPGIESATLGPSSFDVDEDGRIALVDSLQDRLALFGHGRLIDETHLPIGADGMLALDADGSPSLLDVSGEEMAIRSISSAGHVEPSVPLGRGIASQVRSVNDGVYANVLPLDGWEKAPGTGRGPGLTVGMPLPGGRQLLRVAREDSVRLGIIDHYAVSNAVELRSAVRFGEVALAELDPDGAYIVVVRTWREGVQPADQFQVIRVAPDRSVSTFAVSSREFAQAAPQGRFRLGPNGALYQMTSSPEGVRVVRFDLGEELR